MLVYSIFTGVPDQTLLDASTQNGDSEGYKTLLRFSITGSHDGNTKQFILKKTVDEYPFTAGDDNDILFEQDTTLKTYTRVSVYGEYPGMPVDGDLNALQTILDSSDWTDHSTQP